LFFYNQDTSKEQVNFITGLATIDDVCLINVEGTGMVGVPGTANAVFQTVKDAGCNVVMISQASSEHSICFAVRSHEAASAKKGTAGRGFPKSDTSPVLPLTLVTVRTFRW
jgi:aspartokinase